MDAKALIAFPYRDAIGELPQHFYNFPGVLWYWREKEKQDSEKRKSLRGIPFCTLMRQDGGGDVTPVNSPRFHAMFSIDDGSDMEISSGSSGPDDTYDGSFRGDFMFRLYGMGPFSPQDFNGDPLEWQACGEKINEIAQGLKKNITLKKHLPARDKFTAEWIDQRNRLVPVGVTIERYNIPRSFPITLCRSLCKVVEGLFPAARWVLDHDHDWMPWIKRMLLFSFILLSIWMIATTPEEPNEPSAPCFEMEEFLDLPVTAPTPKLVAVSETVFMPEPVPVLEPEPIIAARKGSLPAPEIECDVICHDVETMYDALLQTFSAFLFTKF